MIKLQLLKCQKVDGLDEDSETVFTIHNQACKSWQLPSRTSYRKQEVPSVTIALKLPQWFPHSFLSSYLTISHLNPDFTICPKD